MTTSHEQLSGSQVRTRAAILAATASVLARNRSATLPDIANAAGVGRTTVHRYFADRERLIHEATQDSIRVIDETIAHAATDQGPAPDAMRRFINAMVSSGDRILFLFRDTTAPRYSDRGNPRRIGEAANQPNQEPVIALIKRGQDEGAFDPELSVAWIEHALYALIRQGCEDASRGDLLRHTVAPTVIRTFERGVCKPG
jgi:AcrR family transcriptional regulator